MSALEIENLKAEVGRLVLTRSVGRIAAISGGTLNVTGLTRSARLGDQVEVERLGLPPLKGEVISLTRNGVTVMPEAPPDGAALTDRVVLLDGGEIAPCDAWIGRVIDPFGQPMDDKSLVKGTQPRAIRAQPPSPARRRGLGGRLDTGMAAFDTVLPLVAGQRLGLFAGSGVGKSSLLANLAKGIEADVIVIALIGERGRELRDFVENVLGPAGMERAVIVAATSDQAPQVRRRAAWTAMAVAEYFREQGRNVLLLADSITRFAEAHREIALAAGEAPGLGGFPASTAHMIMSLCERAGPGLAEEGDITAIFTVLVAGSDMEGPIADILRGVLDGHVVLDRTIAERGRYPAIDLLRSVSRSLPAAANDVENELIVETRKLLGAYDRAELMIQSGLYAYGSDPLIDRAIKVWDKLDGFLAEPSPDGIPFAFERLAQCLNKPEGFVTAARIEDA